MSDYMPFDPNPSVPAFQAPKGAVDAHCHVFGPCTVFPFAPTRKYTPVDAPKEKLFALRDHLGFSRNVIVQATCHGTDNAALVDALVASGDMARGVAVVDQNITDAALRDLHAAGVRGVRFNFIKRLVDDTPPEVFQTIARRVTKLGWHIVVYFESHELAGILPLLQSLPGTLVVDHMGRPDVAQGVEGDTFAQIKDFLDGNQNAWVKVSCPERLTVVGPPYDDVVPFARALVRRYPDRALWGTDWPHPNMTSHMPDDGALVDVIPRIAETEELQRKLLIDNPMRLYWQEHGKT